MKYSSIRGKQLSLSILGAALLLFLLPSCVRKLEDLRKDPEAESIAYPSSLLTNAIFNATATLNGQGHTINDQLVQVNVLAQNDNEIHRYKILPGNYTALWNPLYVPMANLNEMLRLAKESDNSNYQAIAYTLISWIMANITDTYGDVPFTEAAKGTEGVITPKFDPQQQIYDSLLVYLERANDLYITTQALTGEDILFNANTAANVVKWKKFTNSLRLRLLMRIEKKGASYQQKLRDLLADPAKNPLMGTVADGAAIYYTGVTPYLNPFANYRDLDFNGKFRFSKFFINTLVEVNDPRLPVWATKSNGAYVGIPTGYPVSDQSAITNSSSSSYQLALKTSKLMGSILQYAEVEFLLAEAALKGYTNDNPKTHYEKGIQASMGYWGVTTVPNEFWQHPKIAWNGTLEQIITQKYFSLFGNGFEQWFEYRRTAFPVLLPGVEMENNGMMPVRLPYPVTERLYNARNYEDAVKTMGPDDLNTKVWWQR